MTELKVKIEGRVYQCPKCKKIIVTSEAFESRGLIRSELTEFEVKAQCCECGAWIKRLMDVPVVEMCL